ncbi:MAG: efflux RND transporter periplasmic adaptor subunit [Bacteroidales bacterium]
MRKKAIIGLVVVLVIAAVVYANLAFKKSDGVAVTVEPVAKRNLESIVSASGTIRAKRTVNITSEVTGKVTRLAVNEGDTVKAGQFLLEVDSRIQRTNVQRIQAGVEQQRIGLQQAQMALESAKINLKLAEDDYRRQSDLWKAQLTTQQDYERASDTLKVRQNDLHNAEQQVARTGQMIKESTATLANAEHDLSKVTLSAPFDGIITKRNVEEGETAQMGFVNNPSVVLLILADMSVIEAEIQVDETDIPNVQIGQKTKITIDAMPDKSFKGHVTEVGNSPINVSAQATASRQATNFKVIVTVDEPIPNIRPGFSCTADITTATRNDVPAVPIQALTVREVTYDAAGNVVRPKPNEKAVKKASNTEAALAEKKPGETKKEVEGVFMVKDGKAEFVPLKTGIAGDKYCEILSGLKPGDKVITGPFSSVRELADGKPVKLNDDTKKKS